MSEIVVAVIGMTGALLVAMVETIRRHLM